MGFFGRAKASVADFGAYRQFAQEPFDKAFGYLVLMVLLLGTVYLVYTVIQLNSGINEMVGGFSRSCPDFVLENGELTVYADMPITVNGDKEDGVIVIDTTGRTDRSVLDKYEQGVFVSRTQVVNKKNRIETQEMNFSELKGFRITKSNVEQWLPKLKYFSVLIVLFGLIYMVIAKLLGAVVLGLVCLLFSAIQGTGLNYGNGIRISVYALTVPTIFQTLQKMVSPGFPHPGLVYYILTLIYLWFSVRANKNEVQPAQLKETAW
ncbi:MAG: DUF1189 domain-containing protein [Bacillota bacterium]